MKRRTTWTCWSRLWTVRLDPVRPTASTRPCLRTALPAAVRASCTPASSSASLPLLQQQLLMSSVGRCSSRIGRRRCCSMYTTYRVTWYSDVDAPPYNLFALFVVGFVSSLLFFSMLFMPLWCSILTVPCLVYSMSSCCLALAVPNWLRSLGQKFSGSRPEVQSASLIMTSLMTS